MEVQIRGNPRFVDFVDTRTHGRGACVYRENNNLYVEFKVAATEPEHQQGCEALLAMSVNDSSKISFSLKENVDKMFLQFVPKPSVGVVYTLGVVFPKVRMLVNLLGKRLFQEYVVAVGYSVEMSLLGKEIDQNKVMGMADEIDMSILTNNEFQDLIDSLHQAFDREILVVRILLKVFSGYEDCLIGNGMMEVIDV